MKRISFFLVPFLVLTALAPITPFGIRALAVSGAPITGPGHSSSVLVSTPTATGPDGLDCDHDNGHDPGDDVCTPTPTATDTPTPVVTTDTATPTPTDTPTSTPTDIPCAVCGTATPTDTPTPTTATVTVTTTASSTPSSTPTGLACTTEQSDFTQVAVGSSVEGLGKVAPDLNIKALNNAIRVDASRQPKVYDATGSNGRKIPNGGMDPGGGFSDVQAHLNRQAHHYVFTFAPGVTVNDFSLHMQDFGDWNPGIDPAAKKHPTNHIVLLTGFDAGGVVVAQQTLSYTTPPVEFPTSSDQYGNLQITGDALSAMPGQPGSWAWDITGTGIVKVRLDFGIGFDPNLSLDHVVFTGCR
jgi:hypothetical protein